MFHCLSFDLGRTATVERLPSIDEGSAHTALSRVLFNWSGVMRGHPALTISMSAYFGTSPYVIDVSCILEHWPMLGGYPSLLDLCW